MTMTTQDICVHYERIKAINLQNLVLPVKIGFFLHRNLIILRNIVQEANSFCINLGKTYGAYNVDDNYYSIAEKNKEQVAHMLQELWELPQEIELYMLKLSDFANIELTYEQLDAIAFMIEE